MKYVHIDSRIKEVTVYPGSAKVTRVATVELTTGDNGIVITNLPLNLKESSLRVSGEGDGSISLGSVELSREFQTDVVQSNEKELKDQIDNASGDLQIVRDSISRNESQLIYINKMAGLPDGQNLNNDSDKVNSYNSLPLDQWKAAWQTLNDSTETVQAEIRKDKKALKESEKLITKLNKELKDIETNQKEIRIAKLHVESDSDATLHLSLNYQIDGASWEPVYDADLNTESGNIHFKTLAQISQRTGEDWNDADVTLSTLRPSAGNQLPQLNPWILDFIPDTFNSSSKMSDLAAVSSSKDPFFLGDDVPLEATPKPVRASRTRAPMIQQQSQLISTDFSAEFKIPGSINLNSGSDKRRFTLYTDKMNSTIKLASSPRFDPRAMLVATAHYQGDTPLLAGNLSLYRNGDFVGNSYLNQKLSGEEIKISFGEDDKVKIKFLPNPDKKRNNGLFGKRQVVERQYKVSISSNHSKPFPITLSDVSPVPSNEAIKIKEMGDEPTNKDVDDKKGVISWDKTLIPEEPLEIQYGYSISYPDGRNVHGL